MNDYFAQRRAGHTLRCDELPTDAPVLDMAACRVGLLLHRCVAAPVSLLQVLLAAAYLQLHLQPQRVTYIAVGFGCLLQDAHADVVLWSSWTSFFSNSLVSIVLVRAVAEVVPARLPPAASSAASLAAARKRSCLWTGGMMHG
jgi:hypothetical protein